MSKLQDDLNMLMDLIYYDKIDPDTITVVITSIADTISEIEKRDSILDPMTLKWIAVLLNDIRKVAEDIRKVAEDE